MPHKEVKSDLITAETIEKMKFSKENFSKLQELVIVQTQQITTINENLETYQEHNRKFKNEIRKIDSSMNYLQNIVLLRGKKIECLRKKIEYLKFRRKIEITVNNVKDAE